MKSHSVSLIVKIAMGLGLAGAGLAAAPLAAGPGSPNGATLFQQRCQSCHTIKPGELRVTGPNLSGVVGRRAASGNFGYSPALKSSGLAWTRDNLDSFLRAPGQKVPGTRMVISVPDAAQRAAIIDFLAARGD